jgi:hypothetical protein
MPIILLAALRPKIKITYLVYQNAPAVTTKERHPCVSSQSQHLPSQSQLSSRGHLLQPIISRAGPSSRTASAGRSKKGRRLAPLDTGNRASKRPTAPSAADRFAAHGGRKRFFVANLVGPRRSLWGLLHDRESAHRTKGQIADSRSPLSPVEVMVRISVITASTDGVRLRGADVPAPTPGRQLRPQHGHFGRTANAESLCQSNRR